MKKYLHIIMSTAILMSMSALSLNSYAAVIYDEAISGDLGGLSEPLTVLTAFDGVNEIKGSNWSAQSPTNTGFIHVTDDKRDAFYLNVSSTMSITAFDIVFSNPVFQTDVNGNDGYGWGYAFMYPNTLGGSVFTSRNILTNDIHTTPSISYIDQTLTQLRIHHNLGAASAAEVCIPDCTWDYTIRITIEDSAAPAVPVPGAVWLFGSGLIGLIGFARRKDV